MRNVHYNHDNVPKSERPGWDLFSTELSRAFDLGELLLNATTMLLIHDVTPSTTKFKHSFTDT